jgi:hypothetical protein
MIGGGHAEDLNRATNKRAMIGGGRAEDLNRAGNQPRDGFDPSDQRCDGLRPLNTCSSLGNRRARTSAA